MNIFVTVEGKTELRVYKKWIPFVNPNMTYAGNKVFDLTTDSFAIISGDGYPQYLDVIKNAIEDINSVNNVDRYVIAVDSEEMARVEKLAELQSFIEDECDSCKAPIFIVVQHFCIETWALGNRHLGPRNPSSEKLKRYKEFFCVYENDPELLPAYPTRYSTRAQFAENYLDTMLKDKVPRLNYSKRNPRALYRQSYFDEVKERFDTTGHIASFGPFLAAFK